MNKEKQLEEAKQTIEHLQAQVKRYQEGEEMKKKQIEVQERAHLMQIKGQVLAPLAVEILKSQGSTITVETIEKLSKDLLEMIKKD